MDSSAAGQRHPADPVGVRFGGQGRQLQGVQGHAGVAVGHVDQVSPGFRHRGPRLVTQPSLLVGQGTIQDQPDLLLIKGLELEYARPRDEWGVDLKEGVLGGGADQEDRPVLDRRRRASCWPLLKRCISSMKRMVRWRWKLKRSRASPMIRRRSATPEP